MPAEYLYPNDADGVAAIPGRSSGGESLPLVDASKFPVGFWSKPARLVVRRAGDLVTILKATGRSGSALAIDGAMDGYADATVVPGDDVRISWTRGDIEAIYGYVDAAVAGKADVAALDGYATTTALSTALAGKEDALPTGGSEGQFLAHDRTWKLPPTADLEGYATTEALASALASKADASALSGYATTAALSSALAAKADATALAGYATTSALAGALATKEDALPTGGTSGQFLAHDRTWKTPADARVLLGGWRTSTDSAPASGLMSGEFVAPAACTPLTLAIHAKTNPAAPNGGVKVQIKVNGADLFLDPVELAATATTPALVSAGFTLTSIPAGATVVPSLADVGAGIRDLRIWLYGREAS